MTDRRHLSWRDDRGQVAGIEALPFGLLLFVVGALMVANFWAVIDCRMAVTAAVREAARAYVEAIDYTQGIAAARRAAEDTMKGYGRDPVKLVLSDPGAGSFRRCQRVTFKGSYPVPALTLPFVGGFGRGFTVSVSHSEIVDPFRSNVPGEAICG